MVSEDNHHNVKALQQTSKKCMKKQRKSETSAIHLSSPVAEGQRKIDGSRLTVYDDGQKVKVVYEVYPGDVRIMENDAHSQKLCQVTSRDGRGKVPSPSDVVTNGRGQNDLQDQNASKVSNLMLICDASSSQPCSGPEDNSTDAHETLTETSTMTFVDAHTIDESGETHSLLGVMEVHINKEFVLIDDDDDGDMSLREKTVTNMSIMDGNAADLVCGRLLSISTDTSSECKEESVAPEPTAQADLHTKKQPCCFCSIL
ncbi:paralemmin-2 [Coregonus clupeaformis]|uniref:paralemmin-2 n=1 Tax=Coregonus clupeaformis TaxID=59861 RepID=UPI001BDF903D|nr:paralemmin-2 [Coregonus clupeaformis]XP_041719496.1 paralemmin-2 [Coregonus clupeaformis]